MLDQLILENFNIASNDVRKVRNVLSEHEKMDITKTLADSMYRQVVKRGEKVDFDLVEATAGDITKLKGYADLENSISTLNAMQASLKQNIREVATLVNALDNLKKQTNNFEQAFRIGSAQGKLLYNSVASSLIIGTSYVIASMVEYVKDHTGNDTALFRGKDINQTLCLDALDKFNITAVNGELLKFFEIALSKRALIGNVIAGATMVVAVFAILPVIRLAIYQFFYMRVKVAEYLRLQAEFVETNRSTNLNSSSYREVSERQEKVNKKLLDLADKIDVDQKASTKKAQLDVKKEDRNVSLTNPSVPEDNDDDMLF